MPSPSGRKWSLAAVAGLVVLNVVLIALLVMRPTPDVSDVPPASLPSPADTATEEAPPEPTESPDEEPTAEPTEEATDEATAAGPARRLLASIDASIAWRGTTGTCDEPGTLEHTTDGGASWEELPMDLAPLVRVRVLGEQALFAIGGGAGCEPTYLSSSTSGTSWLANDEYLEGSWYLHPADRDVVSTPAGLGEVPCEAVDLAGLNTSNGAILCTDGLVMRTEDGGASWQETSPPGSPRAIGVSDGGYLLAGADEGCEGVAVTALSLDGGADESTCADVADGSASDLAVAGWDGAMWLWAGEEVLVSTDGGQSW